MKFAPIYKLIFCSALLFSFSAHADFEDNVDEERASTELVSETEENNDRQLRLIEDQENSENNQIPEDEHPATEDEVINNASHYHTTHHGAHHHSVNIRGKTIELEDGSVWEISSDDISKVAQWRTNEHMHVDDHYNLDNQGHDRILIIENRGWFSWLSAYKYQFINVNRGEKVNANMALTPLLNSVHTHWIEEIDHDNRTIHLEDGSHWDMSWFDRKTLSTFNEYDVVVVGTNTGWFRGSNPNILIRVETMKHVRGSCKHH